MPGVGLVSLSEDKMIFGISGIARDIFTASQPLLMRTIKAVSANASHSPTPLDNTGNLIKEHATYKLIPFSPDTFLATSSIKQPQCLRLLSWTLQKATSTLSAIRLLLISCATIAHRIAIMSTYSRLAVAMRATSCSPSGLNTKATDANSTSPFATSTLLFLVSNPERDKFHFLHVTDT